MEDYTQEQLIAEIILLLKDHRTANSWRQRIASHLGVPTPSHLSELQTHLKGAAKEELIDCTTSLRTNLEVEMAKLNRTAKLHRSRKSLRCRSQSELQKGVSSEWYRARERRSKVDYQKAIQQAEDCRKEFLATSQKLASTEQALDRAKQKDIEQESIMTQIRNQLSTAEQTITRQQSELAILRQCLHKKDGGIEHEARDYKQRLSTVDQELARAREELQQPTATKEQMMQELSAVNQQMREKAPPLRETDEQLTEARRTIAEHQLEITSLHRQLSERQENLGGLFRTSQLELEQAKHTLNAALDELRRHKALQTERKGDLYAINAKSEQSEQEVKDTQHNVTAVAHTFTGKEATFGGHEDLTRHHLWKSNKQSRNDARAITDLREGFGDDLRELESGNDSIYNCQQAGRVGIKDVTDWDADGICFERCCEQIPEAMTNQGCILCAKHCEEFTSVPVTGMGTTKLGGLQCPACGSPDCTWAERLMDFFVER